MMGTLKEAKAYTQQQVEIAKERHMEDQKLKSLLVKGYVPQSQFNLDLVNKHKEMEERILLIMDTYATMGTDVDQRWLAIARTDLEKSFMSLNRAIFKPERVKL